MSSLEEQIKAQGDIVRQMKKGGASKEEIAKEVEKLQALKAQLPPAAAPASSDRKKAAKFELKTPKGTRDYSDKEMAVREEMFATIKRIFRKHGAVTIQTPVFELRDVLTGKYGEDSKLIYDLADQGGESCSLRYDLTVPFARFVAMNYTTHQNIKRFQIAPVYRRDQPAMTKGRMREFYQCDFDIAGSYDAMVPDAEVVRVAYEILTELGVGPFKVKVNNRKILDGIFEVCGVPADKIRTISSAVDKLDKLPWADVRKEMVEEKGLDAAVADRIGEYVKLRGGAELCDVLLSKPDLAANASAKAGIEDMKLFFKYAKVFGLLDKDVLDFDMSLARGLDYYTGIIYEAVLAEEPNIEPLAGEDQVRVGSIAAGGRYDELVGMFVRKKDSDQGRIPCVGVSIGVERVFSVLMAKRANEEIKASETQVYVIAVGGDGLLEERMKIATELWDAGISAEYAYKTKARLQNQYNACDKGQIPYAVIIGDDEVANSVVKIKTMSAKVADEQGGITVARADLVKELRQRLNITN
ncbi:histidyl-tRNA synthetase [Ramicandelaber brevisporus]|nr:histidyl-tRNA synthetase [Ramicandelaber brevisporus]